MLFADAVRRLLQVRAGAGAASAASTGTLEPSTAGQAGTSRQTCAAWRASPISCPLSPYPLTSSSKAPGCSSTAGARPGNASGPDQAGGAPPSPARGSTQVTCGATRLSALGALAGRSGRPALLGTVTPVVPQLLCAAGEMVPSAIGYCAHAGAGWQVKQPPGSSARPVMHCRGRPHAPCQLCGVAFFHCQSNKHHCRGPALHQPRGARQVPPRCNALAAAGCATLDPRP